MSTRIVSGAMDTETEQNNNLGNCIGKILSINWLLLLCYFIILLALALLKDGTSRDLTII